MPTENGVKKANEWMTLARNIAWALVTFGVVIVFIINFQLSPVASGQDKLRQEVADYMHRRAMADSLTAVAISINARWLETHERRLDDIEKKMSTEGRR
jgi:hypothetical protein